MFLIPFFAPFTPKKACLRLFWELASAEMGQKWLKVALTHLFEQSKCLGTTLKKNILDRFLTHG